MYKLVIDLEMNGVTTEDIPKGEIIEIGAVLLDDEYNIIKEYDTYVKPDKLEIRNKVQRMTGITTDKLLFSIKIAEALNELVSITPDIENTTLYTWSESDTFAIQTEMKCKGIVNKEVDKLCNEYKDIQEIFGQQVGIENRLNLTKAMNMIGLEFEGMEHGALADAKNTARVLKEVETNNSVKNTIDNIHSYMESTPLTSTMADLLSKINL